MALTHCKYLPLLLILNLSQVQTAPLRSPEIHPKGVNSPPDCTFDLLQIILKVYNSLELVINVYSCLIVHLLNDSPYV